MKPSDYIRKGWCQGASAKDANDVPVDTNSIVARSWCLTGAISAAYPENPEHRGHIYSLLHDVLTLEATELPDWNDAKDRKHSDVIAVLEQIGE